MNHEWLLHDIDAYYCLRKALITWNPLTRETLTHAGKESIQKQARLHCLQEGGIAVVIPDQGSMATPYLVCLPLAANDTPHVTSTTARRDTQRSETNYRYFELQ
jgi:hypothetical protein